MRRVGVLLAALLVPALAAFAARAGDPPQSGPSVGASASAFDVHDVTGKMKGKKLCYV